MPAAATGYYEGLSYSFEFISTGKDPVSGSLTGGTGSAELEEGTGDLEVTGRDSGGTGILRGTKTGIIISAGQTEAVSVTMAAFTEAGSGTLIYSVIFPDDVIKGTLRVYEWETGAEQGTAVNLLTGATAGVEPNTKTVGGTLPLSAGYYRIALELGKPDGLLRRTDIAHIYPGMDTPADYVLGAGDFNPAAVDTTKTSLAAALASISGPAAGSIYAFFLPGGSEDMAATSVSRSGTPVTVIIDGGGSTVTLTNTGSLVTVGDNVTLVLRNITLQGRGLDVDNTAALVRVENGGKLEMGTGAAITGNKNYSSSSYGGGVYVYSGTFTMNGGEISGNTASSNSSYYSYSSSYSYSYGGGVYVYSGSTFTKQSGGVIYGLDAGSGLQNSAGAVGRTVNTDGHAVYADSSKKRNTTVGTGETLDSRVVGAAGGWE
jgi:hypothetical protein